MTHPADYILLTRRSELIAYWPLDEASGTVAADDSGNGNDGAYTGVELGEPGIGDGRSAPFFDGVSDCVQLPQSTLTTMFNGAEGTLAGWLRVADLTVWAELVTRRAASIRVSSVSSVHIRRSSAANTLSFDYAAGGVSKQVLHVTTDTGWIHVALTWSVAADEMKAYVDGVQVGTTLTDLGTWAGTLGTCVLGGQTATTTLWHGYLAHWGVWSVPLLASEIVQLGPSAETVYRLTPAARRGEPLVSIAQIRAVLTNESATLDAVFNDLILQTHSRIVLELGFDYGRDVETRRLDATDDSVLTLPGPGAEYITSVVEDGVTLETAEYEHDPDNGRYLLRLDSLNKPKDWIAGQRIIAVTYVPARAPEALVAAERVEVVRAFKGGKAGYADRIGVDGTTAIPYSHAFTADTRRLIESLKRGDGVGVW